MEPLGRRLRGLERERLEGVRAQVSDSDSSTHYDLGVAYKEMGLLPDAIKEFALAAQDTKLECTCNAMIGMIYLEKGDLDKSAEAYVRALGATQKTIDQEMSLYYDLGIVYEMKRSNAEALYYFPRPDAFALGPEEYLAQLARIKGTVRVPVIGSSLPSKLVV